MADLRCAKVPTHLHSRETRRDHYAENLTYANSIKIMIALHHPKSVHQCCNFVMRRIRPTFGRQRPSFAVHPIHFSFQVHSHKRVDLCLFLPIFNDLCFVFVSVATLVLIPNLDVMSRYYYAILGIHIHSALIETGQTSLSHSLWYNPLMT